MEQIHGGDLMVVRPGERIPTDRIIIDGNSSLDEFEITGESIPVDKTKEDEVISATKTRMVFSKSKQQR